MHPVDANNGQIQIDDPLIRQGPQGLEVGHRPQGCKPMLVIRVDQLQVGDAGPKVLGPVGLLGKLQGIQYGADAAVAKGMGINLNVPAHQVGHDPVELVLGVGQFPPISGVAQVGRHQCSGFTLQHTVNKQLDRRQLEAVRAQAVPVPQLAFVHVGGILGEQFAVAIGQGGSDPKG